MSDIYKRKKDAMQVAIEKSLEKVTGPPVEDPLDELVSWLSYLLSDESPIGTVTCLSEKRTAFISALSGRRCITARHFCCSYTYRCGS